MRSILTVTTPAPSYDLITTADLQSELNASSLDPTNAAVAVTAASRAIAKYLNRVIVSEVVSETFRAGRDASGYLSRAASNNPSGPQCLNLRRRPVSAVNSIAEDGLTLDATDYELDAEAGQIFRLVSDQPGTWRGLKITVSYTAGYIVSGSGANLPADIVLAARRLAATLYQNREREPGLRSLIVPGVIERQYWDQTRSGQADDQLPADIRALLDGHREALI